MSMEKYSLEPELRDHRDEGCVRIGERFMNLYEAQELADKLQMLCAEAEARNELWREDYPTAPTRFEKHEGA